jgi:hypothetical protein
VFTVAVAEDAALFKPTFVKSADTQPERGSFFVTEGNIYPAGTIQGDGATFDPNSDGAIGCWFCRGTHLVSGPNSHLPLAASLPRSCTTPTAHSARNSSSTRFRFYPG